MPPKVVGPYRVLDTLGAGGAGTVYRALDRRTNEHVALKLLSGGPAMDPRAARRLAREFETLAELSHPNVVKVFDTGVFQGYPYLAMELIEGLTLRHYLSLRGHELHTPSGSFSAPGPLVLTPPHHGLALAPPRVPWAEPDDVPSGETEHRPFDLSSFAEEEPSEDGSFDTGPEGLRAFAARADEDDTPDSDSYDLPYSLPKPAEAHPPPPPARLTPQQLEELNREDRVGRLKDSVLQLCEALAYVHGHGLVHRDLKPSNIMVDEDRQVRLMDFGLAKWLADDSQVTQDGKMVGTFRYMAPEQILGEPLDGRADLYSLGVVLYELMCGRPPYDARTPYELWQKVLETEAVPVLALNPGGDAQLARVAHRLIRKEPDDRFQTAEEVLEALSE